jgi:hypothetical protein
MMRLLMAVLLSLHWAGPSHQVGGAGVDQGDGHLGCDCHMTGLLISGVFNMVAL